MIPAPRPRLDYRGLSTTPVYPGPGCRGFKEHDRSRQEAVYGATGNPLLHKNLKTIQMQFIAFGGAIGMRRLPKKTALQKLSANEST